MPYQSIMTDLHLAIFLSKYLVFLKIIIATHSSTIFDSADVVLKPNFFLRRKLDVKKCSNTIIFSSVYSYNTVSQCV